MPNRILKESITTSENIDALSPFHETVFYRLIVVCDDYGRMDARPKLLSSRLFPLKDIRAGQIEDALKALEAAQLVTLYTVDGKPYLQMTTWGKHQRIRNSIGKYPSPDCADLRQDAASCGEMRRDDAECRLNPIQSNPNPNPNPNPNAQQVRERFELFWTHYPRHTAKQSAFKAFAKLNPDDSMIARMLNAIEQQKKSDQWTKDNGAYIPHPSTWINQARWEDELPQGGKTVHAQQYAQRDYSTEEPEPTPDWMVEAWERMQKDGTA